MFKNELYISIFILLLFGIGEVSAQSSRIAGLEKNSKYMELLKREQHLRSAEDSVMTLISQNRSLFQSDTANKDAYGTNIIRLEGELYDIRDKMGDITSQATIIEQEFIINNINNGVKVTADTQEDSLAAPQINLPKVSTKDMLSNYLITQNLSPQVIAALRKSASAESIIPVVTAEFSKAYAHLEQIWRAYAESKTPSEVDSLLAEREKIMEYIIKVNDTVRRRWLPIYNLKIENYPVLVDKLPNVNRTALYSINELSRNIRRTEALSETEDIAPAISLYPMQKELILEYEELLASALDMPDVLDSLEKAIAELPEYKPATAFHFAEKILVVYSPVTVAKTPQYSDANPVPEVIVPDKGLYYMLQIATFSSAPKSISFLKGVTPVSYQKMSDGKIRYLAGGFNTYKEVMDSYRVLTGVGFKPTTAAWIDGEGVALAAARTYETNHAKKVAAAAVECRIEITPTDGLIPDLVRDILKSDAADKSITRVDKEGVIIYSVGVFDNHKSAQAVVDAISDKDPELKTEIINM